MKYNKLVRDKIPAIIEAKGNKAVIHIADMKEYRKKLLEKLKEEMKEFFESETPEELADILEVVYALAKEAGVDKEDLETLRLRKFQERGGFDKRIVLDETL
jgi:predicted house-cleaning noncanonical NTP pyrophosphatase (MazG superfamily)